MSITSEEAKALTTEVRGLGHRIGWITWIVVGGTISLIVDLILTVTLTVTIVGVVDNENKINTLQSQVQMAGERNQTALCALLGIFFQLQPNLAKSPNYTPDQKATQLDFFGTLHTIAADLQCPQK